MRTARDGRITPSFLRMPASVSPLTSSITRYSSPSSVCPKSWMVIVLGCDSADAALASCMKRFTALTSVATFFASTLIATSRPTAVWVPRNTAPIPPAPSFESMR